MLCDARSLQAYSDELDALREKAVKIDSLFSFSKLVLVGPIDCAISDSPLTCLIFDRQTRDNSSTVSET